MTLYNVYRQKEYIQYYSHYFSRSSVFIFIFTIVPLFVSLISAYRSYGFYQTTAKLTVQPKVSLTSDMLVQFYRTGSNKVSSWSNFKQLEEVIPTISVHETDSDNDGVKESLSIQIRGALPDVSGMRILLQFYYVVESLSSIHIQQPIVFSFEALQPLRKVSLVSRIGFSQKSRLPSAGIFSTYNSSLLNSSADVFKATNQLLSSRNFTLRLVDSFTSYDPAVGAAANTGFELNLELLYSPVTLEFHSEFWFLVKWAWVQWFYFLLFFQFCFQRFKEFTMESYAVPSKLRLTADLDQIVHGCGSFRGQHFDTSM